MPKKKKSKRKPTSLRIILIGGSILVIAALLLMNGFQSGNKGNKGSTVKRFTSGEQPLRHDADVFILDNDSNNVASFKVEIAETEQSRAKGLMYRSIMPFDRGMYFIFERDEPRSFWMKNTNIPLDIIYINNNMEIVRVQKDTRPRTLDPVPSDYPARYVLEINAGLSDRYGIKEGQSVLLNKLQSPKN